MAAPSLSASGVMTSLNFSLLPSARPPETMILAAVSSGRSLLANLAAFEFALAVAQCSRGGFHCCRCHPWALPDRSRVVRTVTTLFRVGALHGGNGVAGVDRALEGVGADHLGDVGELAHVQLGGHARCHVLAAGRGREQDVAVVAGDGQHLRGDVFSQAVFEARASAWMTLATPAICAAALAAAPALCPATSTCTSPPHWAAAVTVLRVAA
jgi:hypothetical protein